MRALCIIGQVENIFGSKVIILPNNRQNCLEIEAIKFSFFPILMRTFWKWPNALQSIASLCFHAVFFFANNCWNKQN